MLQSRCFLLNSVRFRITASYSEYLRSLPSDVLGDLQDIPIDHDVETSIYIIDAPGQPAAAAAPDALFLAGSFPPGDRSLSLKVGVKVLCRYIIRRFEDFDIFHLHASAIYQPSTRSVLIFGGPPHSGKSLSAFLAAADTEVRLVANTFLPFTSKSGRYSFFRGSSRWAVRPEVIETASFFFERRTAARQIVITIPGQEPMDEIHHLYDVSDRLIDEQAISADSIDIVWPRIAPAESVARVQATEAKNRLREDLIAFLRPREAPGTVIPKGWHPEHNDARDDAIEALVGRARTLRQITGSPQRIIELAFAGRS